MSAAGALCAAKKLVISSGDVAYASVKKEVVIAMFWRIAETMRSVVPTVNATRPKIGKPAGKISSKVILTSSAGYTTYNLGSHMKSQGLT